MNINKTDLSLPFFTAQHKSLIVILAVFIFCLNFYSILQLSPCSLSSQFNQVKTKYVRPFEFSLSSQALPFQLNPMNSLPPTCLHLFIPSLDFLCAPSTRLSDRNTTDRDQYALHPMTLSCGLQRPTGPRSAENNKYPDRITSLP